MSPVFGFGDFGKFIYYTHYSRNGEHWVDTVIRIINGIFSIRKDWYIKHHIYWNENQMQKYAFEMSQSLFKMKWLPPGRGLWAMGTPLIYERGAMALYNCAFTTIDDIVNDNAWLMDLLMHGVGVGFEPNRTELKLYPPEFNYPHTVADSREGWVESVALLLGAFTKPQVGLPEFDYSKVRPKGSPIKTFGGTASGPEPLIELHQRISALCYDYLYTDYDVVEFKTDIANCIGCCVVAGNLRRSAEIAIAHVSDPVFTHLKNYDKYPDREAWGWMSNNTVKLGQSSDFDYLPTIAYNLRNNGEPGILNMHNLQYGRISKDDEIPLDDAIGINPCGEIPLENKEVCNVVETVPTRCTCTSDWLEACEYATFYASTVSLLPTHQYETNAIIAKNRRIGVSIVDVNEWKQSEGVTKVTKYMREGYRLIRQYNYKLNIQAGVPSAIRVTTIKPGGTGPKLPGRISGISYPNANYILRRVRLQADTPAIDRLIKSGYHIENDYYSQNTVVVEFPIAIAPIGRTIGEVSIWEQAMTLVWVQREWADNAVSNTLFFKSSEIPQLESVLSSIVPLIKSLSMCPISTDEYVQMPEEPISKLTYEKKLETLSPIDWRNYQGIGIDEKYCTGDACEITNTTK